MGAFTILPSPNEGENGAPEPSIENAGTEGFGEDL